MLTQRNLCTLWLLLLLHVSGHAMRFNLFQKNIELQEGDVRLSGSGSDSEGRVEVYHEGRWGTVCDDGWDLAEAQVVCRQLQFPRAKSVVIGTVYGQASGPIWLDDIACKGTENRLTVCAFKSWGLTDCTHKEDVGVICETGTNVTMSDSAHSLDHSNSLSEVLGQIFDSGNGCDFLISVQSATGNRQENGTLEMVGTTICTHKLILSQFPLFKATEGISSITVDVSQSCQPHFTSFIRYIYTRKLDVTFYSAQCLHWMASQFGVKQLMEDTGRLFSKILPEDALFHTQVSLYQYAKETGDLVLQENCVQYLAWNYQNLTGSPAWSDISVELLEALLVRSDLVVPDEYVLLQSVEDWITEKGSSIGLKSQVNLVNLIRFPMIPAEVLYQLEFNSSLYNNLTHLYRENMLKAFQFNVLLFSDLSTNPKFSREDDDYQPRIYTAEPWSTVIDSERKTSFQPNYNHYNYNQRNGHYSGNDLTKYLDTPVHNSMIFKNNKIRWAANVFTNRGECSNRGLRCESLPVARLAPQNQLTQQGSVLYRNQVLLMCQGKFICHVQGFKDTMAYISVNSTHDLTYPCPDDKYSYHFVLRPEYV